MGKILKKKFSGHVIIKEQTLMTSLYHNQATRQSTRTSHILVPLFLSVHVCTHTLTVFPPTLLSESGTARRLVRHKRLQGRPCGSVVKNPPANAGDTGLLPGSGRSPGEGNSNPLQYSWLGHPMDRGAWQVTVHGVAKDADVTWRLNNTKCLYGEWRQTAS